MSIKTETAEHKRKRLAFMRWLRKQYACKEGRRFVRGKTAREFWMSRKTEEHQGWMRWFYEMAHLSEHPRCLHAFMVPGGPSAVRKLVKLPRVFEWERKQTAK